MSRLPVPSVPTSTVVQEGTPRKNVFFCPWCEDMHSHGLPPGRRAPHCTREDSPFRATGYRLDVYGTVATATDVVPDAPLACGPYLNQGIDQASPLLRNIVLRFALGRRFAQGFAEGRVKRARVQVCGDYWQVAPKGLKRGEEFEFAAKANVVEGRGLIGLLMVLYGLPAGVIAVRLLEAVAFRSLDAEARLAVAGAIDAWAERERAKPHTDPRSRPVAP